MKEVSLQRPATYTARAFIITDCTYVRDVSAHLAAVVVNTDDSASAAKGRVVIRDPRDAGDAVAQVHRAPRKRDLEGGVIYGGQQECGGHVFQLGRDARLGGCRVKEQQVGDAPRGRELQHRRAC